VIFLILNYSEWYNIFYKEGVMFSLFGILVLGVLFLAALAAGIYNKLVSLKNRYKNAFAQIEVQLKRRHDLIPNLVEVAKGYMKHEKETLEGVINARNRAVSAMDNAKNDPGDASKMEALGGAENMLTGALSKLFALSESYPDLKANQNMMQLHEELTSTENKVSFARQSYNDAVMAFNTYRQTFPAVLVANYVGFAEDASLLEFDKSAISEPPKVTFGE